jgi:hypothetical protein
MSRMTAEGRYAEICIATPMRRSQLCGDFTGARGGCSGDVALARLICGYLDIVSAAD